MVENQYQEIPTENKLYRIFPQQKSKPFVLGPKGAKALRITFCMTLKMVRTTDITGKDGWFKDTLLGWVVPLTGRVLA